MRRRFGSRRSRILQCRRTLKQTKAAPPQKSSDDQSPHSKSSAAALPQIQRNVGLALVVGFVPIDDVQRPRERPTAILQ